LFPNWKVLEATLYQPWRVAFNVRAGEPLEIPGDVLHILVE
jgi:hypothetical protein